MSSIASKPLVSDAASSPLRALAARWGSRAIALGFVALALAGIVRQYAAVPHYDRWATIHFYARLAGDWRAWWAQHNEHRIVLARPFYWIDCAAFACNERFLLAMNFALFAAMALLLAAIGRRLLREPSAVASHVVPALVATLCFSWLQFENLTLGFQFAFIAAYVLPLAAFVVLARAMCTDRSRSRAAFGAALALGVASAFTMANGVAALPLLVIMAALARASRVRIAALALAAAVVGVLYFTDYETPGNHRAIGDALRDDPIGFARFVLALIGAPLGGVTGSTTAAGFAGVAILAAALAAALRWRRERSADQLALLMLVAYILISMSAIASGRLFLGLPYALSSRYQTLALVAWAATILVVAAQWRSHRGMAPAFASLAAVIALALLPSQLRALSSAVQYERYEKSFAALALELGVRDTSLVRTVYPSDDVYAFVEEARERAFAMFGEPALIGLRATMGRSVRELGLVRCVAMVDSSFAVEGRAGASRLTGALDVSALRVTPPRFYFATSDGQTVGAGVLFRPTVEWRSWLGRRTSPVRFGAYLLESGAQPPQAWCPRS